VGRSDTDVVVIGAGPAGLAVSACLERAGVPHVLLEREASVAPAWRRHYDRLHLHTSRAFSSLPYHPMPRSYPRYPSRDQVVAYLEAYARSECVTPSLGVEVRSLEQAGGGWIVGTTDGPLTTKAVVVATGANGEPKTPTWPGLESFPGPVLHSSAYRNGTELAGKDVLVVGFGNSGGEIALDLAEHGAHPAVSVRSPVNVIPRDVLGIPVLAIAIPLSRLPAGLADLLIWPILRAYYPSYRRMGLRKAPRGPFRQIAEDGHVPLLDIGTIRGIRRGHIQVLPDVAGVSGASVGFADGEARSFDAIVFATGYRPCLPAGVSGVPVAEGVGHAADDAVGHATDDAAGHAVDDHVGGASGLYYCGLHVSPTGMLREVGIEARRIAERVAEHIDRSRNGPS
jgi:indole-3-pyruvate monooxygenase